MEEVQSMGDSEIHRSQSQYRNQTKIKYLSKMQGNNVSFFCTCSFIRIGKKEGLVAQRITRDNKRKNITQNNTPIPTNK